MLFYVFYMVFLPVFLLIIKYLHGKRGRDSAKTAIEGERFSEQGERFSEIGDDLTIHSGGEIQRSHVHIRGRMQKPLAPPYDSGNIDSMSKEKALPSLFEESELGGIQATGKTWAVSADDPATVPIPLQIVIVNVKGPHTEKDRKLFALLLHHAFDELGTKPMHEISVAQIDQLCRELGGDHGVKWTWQSAKNLAETTVEWEYDLGDERVQGVSSLFYAQYHKSARSTGRLTYGFPPPLIPILKHPMRFARLRVHFLMKLSGKYAVTLYEILEGFANRRDGECRVTIEELRQWLKVPEGSYSDWKDLKKWVLKPAIEQINADPLGAGFSIEYTPKRKGRFYDEIVFKLTKTDGRKAQERNIRTAKDGRARMADLKAKGRPDLSEHWLKEAAHATRYKLDMKEIERQFWAHWESTGKPDFEHVGRAFVGFAKKKAKA